MKKLLKASIPALATSIMLTVNSTSVFAVHSSNNYFYDVKKAGDYILNYCDANYDEIGLPEGRVKKINDTFFYNDGGGDCTNFVSQALYYGGYNMRGTPPAEQKFPYTMPKNKKVEFTGKNWYYYKLKGATGYDEDIWTSSWTTVDGPKNIKFLTAGIDNYLIDVEKCKVDNGGWYVTLKGDDTPEYLNKLFVRDTNIKRGDILQVKDGFETAYNHSCFVWCTTPMVRLSSHTDSYLSKSIEEMSRDHPSRTYRIIHTTDHADPTKSIW